MSKGLLKIVLLTCVLLLLGTCAAYPPPDRPDRQQRSSETSLVPDPPANDCGPTGRGNDNRVTPVVCVEKTASGVTVHPTSIEVYDTEEVSKNPTPIHWVTRSGGGTLSIRMKSDGCVDPPKCVRGHCSATARDVTKTERKQCSYAVTLDGVELDPDVIIVDCCT